MKVTIDNTPRVTLTLGEREAKVVEHALFIAGYTEVQHQENVTPIAEEARNLNHALGDALDNEGIEILTAIGLEPDVGD